MQIRNRLLRGLLGALLLLAVAAPEQAAAAAEPGAGYLETRLLRFPDLAGDRVVFVYAGDLWLTSSQGGVARRLTSHPGLELFPKFSPDGKWLAFTGQYDGDEQVYVMPAQGGVPRQLTFYPARGPLPPRWGYDHQVVGWTPDGKSVLYRSYQDTWDVSDSRLYTVPLEGGPSTALPMPTSGAGALSPDGTKVAYSPLSRDFRTWKRYQGGWAQDLYLFDLKTDQVSRLTQNPRTDRDPMWFGDKLYFASDRDGTLNLYRQPFTLTQEPEQLTHSTTWDVRWPSADEANQKIIFELGGQLQILDAASGQTSAIRIWVPDDGVSKRPAQVSAEGEIEGAELSPKGERVVFAARGDLFSAPIEKGPTRNLTHSSNAHDKAAAWSPDGREIAFISDLDGEEEIYVVPQDGSAPPTQLTDGGSRMRYRPVWSPDSQRIAFSDMDGKLFVLTVAERKVVQVADDPRGFLLDYVWSPDSNYLAFSMSNDASYAAVYIWGRADGTLHRVSDELFNTTSPAWDPNGNYLYVLADREWAPQFSSLELNFATNRHRSVVALALRKDVGHLFPAQSDEVSLDEPAKAEAAKDDKKPGAKAEKKDGEKPASAEAGKTLVIDFDGIASRAMLFPLPPENYFGLSANAENVFLVMAGAGFLGRESYAPPSLHVFSLADRKLTQLAGEIGGYTISEDGTKLLVQEGQSWTLMDARPGGDGGKKVVSTSGLKVDRIPAEEWRNAFDEVWRRFRDWFYVENMHGYDWKAIGDRYRALLPDVGHRSDLNYLLGEMIAELSTSHSYVSGGDYDLPKRARVALPGARFALDEASGRFRISKIFSGENDEDRYRAPLTEVGVDARVGDYVLAIDGHELKANEDPYQFLRNKADRQVELTLNGKPSLDGARKVSYHPITSETELIYLDWVDRNRAKVAEATGGRVGYLHIPDMGEDGMREFIKWYFPQIRKEGLVVDVRGNGGGFVSPMIIERLRRGLLGVDWARTDERPATYPGSTFWGSMVCLLSETSASDGDIFPYMFRQAGLGPLVGKRSWGGVVGISDHGPLIDGGQVFVPESASVSIDGRWIIEGYGVAPDIEVDNDPAALIAGRDAQLERGIAEVMAAMQANPRHLPPRPPAPVRTQQHYDAVPTGPVH